MSRAPAPDAPAIRILSGNPDDAELAALAVALAAVLRARPAPPPGPVRAAWLRGPVHVPPESWTAPPPARPRR